MQSLKTALDVTAFDQSRYGIHGIVSLAHADKRRRMIAVLLGHPNRSVEKSSIPSYSPPPDITREYARLG